MEGDIIMKKVSFRVRNFDKEQFLTFDIDDEAELDEELLDFLEEEEPRGIVPVIFEDGGEEQDTFSYNITDRIHICELSNQEINAEMVLKVMWGLVQAFIDMAEYRVPLSYLVLHRNYIYIDSDYRVEFICIPLSDMQEQADVNSFLRNLIASLRFDPSENGDYVAKLLSYVNNRELFNLHNMLALVEELMEEYGIEIPEVSEDIYVDYKEVEEKSAADIVDELDEEIPAETREETIKDTVEEQPEETIEEADRQAGEPEEEEETVLKQPEDTAGELEEEEETVPEQPEDTAGELEEEDETVLKQPEDTAGELEEEEETVLKQPEDAAGESEEEDEAVWEQPEDTAGESEEEDEAVWEQPEDAAGESEEEDETVWEQPEDAAGESEEDEEAREIVDQLKNKVKKDVQAETAEEVDTETDEDKKKGLRRPVFKTKETQVTGVVIQDELDEFLAEKEREEQEAHREESGLKIKKNIKVNRASIVKNSQEEQKEAEEVKAEPEEPAEDSGLEEDAEPVTTAANAAVPKVNPYLIRVNTDERIMITKQTFRLGKASMGVDYTVKGNSAVSRVHAVITCKDGVYSVKDNKSTNHTFVNGKILEEGESVDLSNDSKIVLGDEEFIFKLN